MLIRKEHTKDGGLLGIWKIEETREELLQLFPGHLRSEADTYLRDIRSERRSIEWLSTRLMLLDLLGKEQIILNRKDGSPYLDDGKNNISISHTKNYAAILLHESAAVGVDIETRSERVIKIAVNSFLIRNILIRTKNCTQLLHWSAKESLFKLMDEQGIDFKQHLHIHPFIPGNKGMIAATETKTEQAQSFCLQYEVHTDYVLTWVISPALK